MRAPHVGHVAPKDNQLTVLAVKDLPKPKRMVQSAQFEAEEEEKEEEEEEEEEEKEEEEEGEEKG